MIESTAFNRRDFLKKAMAMAAVAAAGTLPVWATASSSTLKLTILHTNDVHSRIEPFPMDGSRFQGLGGAARRSTLIQQIRQAEERVLLLDSGDIFQGTPYFNLFGGKLELELMSAMGYEAGTFGNHEFDNGLAGLAQHLDKATFPFLTANYDFRGTILEGKTQDYTIIHKNGLRIGLLGVGIDINGLVDPNSFKGMRYLDPVPVVNRIAKDLKTSHNCDLVICLSHLGYEYEGDKISDVKLAEQTSYVDIILGGHTHTFLDKPRIVQNTQGNDVLINQMGFAGIRLGRLDVNFNKKTGKKQFVASHYTLDNQSKQQILA